ncbi:uncharacterized protein LOC113859593 [Abrus precatorius]|uniref:Uncharacterized protein LOC113859593 n=1 Tax=Abrus precatorius TaxID=3816 RepID=A0A8B8KW76_ABRPR|nr:uncharacterized protein LOC113859593 [Abrus precatorius]
MQIIFRRQIQVHDIDHGYESEELLSNDSEKDDYRRKYSSFNADELNKDHKLKLGLEFGSIKEFKDAIRKYNVLNGKEIRFDLNDKTKVRARCRHCAEYSVYVSKVSNSETYKLNTLFNKHICGRVFHNKSAKLAWVAKILINKMKAGTTDITLKDIVGEIISNYSTGITLSRAFRAKHIAKSVIDGNIDKQYGLLWRYAAELKQRSVGNTCVIRVFRSSLEILPRFRSFYMCLKGPKLAFKKACRPLIGVDDCHLKNKFGGQLLIFVRRDPNAQHLPLAFGD